MAAGRVEHTPGYVLHHQPWREHGRILEVLTREHGRLSLFAHGVRGPKAQHAGVLQPFVPLLLSWQGRGEAPRFTGAERHPDDDQAMQPLPPSCILSGYYLSELVMKLTVRHDPQPEIFDHYHQALVALKSGAVLERELRLFEKRLLDTLGYGIDTAALELGTEEDRYYHYRPSEGLQLAAADSPGRISGRTLRSLAAERLDGPGELDEARWLLRVAIGHCLEGKMLRTRQVARALVRTKRTDG
jgi:DNA repair protein RecO (recombination protein O)